VTADVHATVEARLRAVGQRYTPKRRELVEALRRAGRPAATNDRTGARDGLPQSSVYRNLAVLEQIAVARRVMTEEGTARYELAEDLTEHHHHLVCRDCGAVEDVTMPGGLERTITRALTQVAEGVGFVGVSHRLDLVGTCRRCGGGATA
jgi:Fe2+ or Zn2+ uptake regulation protein